MNEPSQFCEPILDRRRALDDASCSRSWSVEPERIIWWSVRRALNTT
jgi:hypothetical protein